VVVGITADVGDVQDYGFLADVLPSLRGVVKLGPDVAGLMRDRNGALARALFNFARLDKDDRRPVGTNACAPINVAAATAA
jgi:hypothetical protein